jgi:hypothetical protein
MNKIVIGLLAVAALLAWCWWTWRKKLPDNSDRLTSEDRASYLSALARAEKTDGSVFE